MSIPTPLISVVIPAFNSERSIERCINSVLKQTYPHIEILVIDDCSLDKTKELALKKAREGAPINVYSTTINSGGPAAPRNIGIEKSNGEIIAFLDADDEWHPNKLAVLTHYMVQHDVDLICCDLFIVNSDERREAAHFFATQTAPKLDDSVLITHQDLLKKNTIPLSSTQIRRSSLGAHTFSEKNTHVAVEDYRLWLMLTKTAGFHCVRLPIKLVMYVQSKKSLSASKSKMLFRVWRLLGEFDLSHIPIGLGRIYYLLTYLFLSLRFNKNKARSFPPQ